MEWTKIKPKHFLYTDYSIGNVGTMTLLICLTAYLERMPTRQEMIKATHMRALESLEKKVMNHSCTIDEVLMKVLEDADGIERKRAISRKTSETYREKQEAGDMSHDTTDKIREDKRREDKKKENKKGRFTPPSVLEVKEFCIERKNRLDAQSFVDFYESKGWLIGKNKMKDWKAAIRTWEKRHRDLPEYKKVQMREGSCQPAKNLANEALENMKKWEKEAA